jgi:hypothetical protein
MPAAVFGHTLARDGADRPAGVFVQWNWDGRELTVVNDRFGMGQLLYGLTDQPRGIVLSPHLEQLLELGVAAEFDDDAISVLVRVGFLLDCDTPLRTVRALPPGARLIWRPGSLAISGGSNVPAERSVARDEAIEGFIELFRQSIRRRPFPRGRTVLPLTGGHDSRHILFELCHQGTAPDLCVTVRLHPRDRYDDAFIASQVAQSLSVPHEILLPQRSAVQEDFRKYRRMGVMSDEGGWASIMADRIHTFQCAYDGIGGDMLSSGYLAGIKYDETVNNLVQRGQWRALAERIVGHFSAPEDALAPLLHVVSFRDAGRDYVIERISAELARFENSGHPLAMFIIHNRTRREIAMTSALLCSEVPTYYAPYLDDELFDFLAALPARDFAFGQWFHRAVIDRAYSAWSELPYLDKRRLDRHVSSAPNVLRSILELRRWASQHVPSMAGSVSRWGMHRVLTRAASSSAPRRVVQHLLVVEELLQRWSVTGN